MFAKAMRAVRNTDPRQSSRQLSVKRANIGCVGQATSSGLFYDSIDNVWVSMSEVDHGKLRNHVNICFAISV